MLKRGLAVDLPEQTPFKKVLIRPKVLKRGLAVDLPEQTPFKQKSGLISAYRGFGFAAPER